MNLNKYVLGAICSFAFNYTAHATTIPTVNGFVPLQYTENLSIADFNAGVGGWSLQYHLASSAEVSGLLQSYGIASHILQPASSNEWAFIRQIGGTTLGPDGTYFSDGAQGIIGRSYDAFVSIIVSNGENSQAVGNCPSFRECTSPSISYTSQPITYKDNQSGLFLIEGSSVPEPSSIALIGLGLGTLMLRRRRA